MKFIKFALMSIKFNWNSQLANPANLFMGFVGMAINNTFFMMGLYAIIFGGKPQNQHAYPYFLAATTISFFSWGFVYFFFGGLRNIPTLIDNGAFEQFLGTPKSPLVLASLTEFEPSGLADMIQGILCMVLGAYLYGFSFGFKLACASIISVFGVLSLLIFAAAISFFVRRGADLAVVIVHSTLSMSVYPVGIIFTGLIKSLLYLTPAAIVTLLPVDAAITGQWYDFIFALFLALIFLGFSILFFNLGRKKYVSSNFVSIKGS